MEINKTFVFTAVDEPKFRYTPGTTYVYRYEASTLTTLQGAIDEGSGLHVEATAEIQVLTPCDMVLRVCNNYTRFYWILYYSYFYLIVQAIPNSNNFTHNPHLASHIILPGKSIRYMCMIMALVVWMLKTISYMYLDYDLSWEECQQSEEIT